MCPRNLRKGAKQCEAGRRAKGAAARPRAGWHVRALHESLTRGECSVCRRCLAFRLTCTSRACSWIGLGAPEETRECDEAGAGRAPRGDKRCRALRAWPCLCRPLESAFGVVLVDPAAVLWAMERPALKAVRRASCLDVRRKTLRKRGVERVERGGESERGRRASARVLDVKTRRRGRET